MTDKKNKPVILSGIQPSGQLNIGHYIGAIRNWVNLQEEYDCLFCLVDMHAITVRQDPKQLRERCYEQLALYIACGIDPEKNLLFVQSQVPAHARLGWILNCYTQMGELNRMTQFKDKSKQHEHNINIGLFDYPVLMAADILLYDANLVPVGHDQTQHLELTRDIAMRFNNLYGEIFTIPEIFLGDLGSRLMSLQDPTKKMSKSDANENSYINLLDPPDLIRQKMKRATTDSGKEIYFDLENKPGIANLLTLLAAVTNKTMADTAKQYETTVGYANFKSDVAEALVSLLEPIQKHYRELRQDQTHLEKILKNGADKASERANKKLKQVHDAIGFI